VTAPDQSEFWDARADLWTRHADAIDSLSGPYGLAVMDALAIEPGERVLDVGCGTGTTVLELARRVGPDGAVVGLDISPAMVAAARSRAEAAGVANATFVAADAQTADLTAEPFDVVFSRFGVMFFPDATAGFTNLARALRPGGRLGAAVWRGLQDNPWMFVPTLTAVQALNAGPPPIPGPDEPGPFSLADEAKIRAVLTTAGFDSVALEPLSRAQEWTDGRSGVRTLLEIGPMRDAFGAADAAEQERVIDAVLEALTPYRTDDGGYSVPGGAWAVTAVRS